MKILINILSYLAAVFFFGLAFMVVLKFGEKDYVFTQKDFFKWQIIAGIILGALMVFEEYVVKKKSNIYAQDHN